MDQSFYTQFDELPLTLCATDIAAILNISRSNAYMLLRREDFPTLHIGKRMLTPNSAQRKPIKGCTVQGTHAYMFAANSDI